MALTTAQLVSILSGNTSPEAQQALDFVNKNPGLGALERQAILNAVNAAAPQPTATTTAKPATTTTTNTSTATAVPPKFVQDAWADSGLTYTPTTGTTTGTTSYAPTTAAPQAPKPAVPQVAPPIGTPEWVQWMVAQGFTAEQIQAVLAQQKPAGGSVVTDGTGEINAPYGADFLAPTLGLYGQLAGQAESGRQFDISTLLSAAQGLASLFAAGPASAAELAFLNAGMGFPAVGGNRAAIEDLVGAATRGASGNYNLDIGGQKFSVPSTLSGQQLQSLQGNENLKGVLGSFAKAAGNPDIFARSIASLVPSNFQPAGSGLF